MTRLRRAMAEHLVRSKRTAPHVTTVAEVNMTALVEFLERRKTTFQLQEGVPLTYLPFIIKAVCPGLKAFPSLNASLEGRRSCCGATTTSGWPWRPRPGWSFR